MDRGSAGTGFPAARSGRVAVDPDRAPSAKISIGFSSTNSLAQGMSSILAPELLKCLLMMTLPKFSALFSSMTVALAALSGCSADAGPGDQASSQNSLGGVASASPKPTACSTYDGSQQKCEAQPMCDYIATKNLCVDAPGSTASTTPSSAADPCTQKFGSDQKLCESVAPKCAFDAKNNVCILGSGAGGSTTISKCGSYTDPNACLLDKACTYDKAKMACVDVAGNGSTVSTDASSAVSVYCFTTYGTDQKGCTADAKCVFDTQRGACRGR